MNDTKDILTLLGIPGDKISSFLVESNGNETHIFVELSDERGYCPHCHSTEIGIKDYYPVTINNSIIKHEKLIVHVRMRRFVCKKCGKSFKQKIDFYSKKSSISDKVKRAILDDLKQRITMVQISKDHNVSLNTVRRLLEKCVLPQIALPLTEIICVDEFCFKHHGSKGKYPFVITDPMTGKIIDIVESRWKNVLFDYFNKVKIQYRYNVKYFVSDMNDTYRDVKRAFFRDAIHIADRFHVVKMFNEAITAIRTRIIKQEVWEDKEYRYLKKNWKIFLKSRKELQKIKVVDKLGIVTDPTEQLDICLKKYPELHYSYWTKEEFINKTKCLMYYGAAADIIDFYIAKLTNSTITEMNKIGKTLKNWRYEIINGLTSNPYSIKISNAIAEATNNQIQTLIDISYGLPDFKIMRKRTLYINRNEKD